MMIKGTAPAPPTIDLQGLFGSFHVGQSDLRINFFSTFANPTRGGGPAELVKQLKPMRERIDASKLTDLRSLLQRDLDDNRVARELIPYLKGEGTAGIGFFPAILAVLVPSGYLAGENVEYPRPVTDLVNSARTDYGHCWTVERYRDEETSPLLPVGLLKIIPSNADVIVLDGQHRANAFRYMANDLSQTTEIYQTFYSGLNPDNGKLPAFDADLPVTLIWFEAPSNEEIRPNFISRRLFVDVNNSAKRVSTSRTILLDDRSATCIGTTQLYNSSAQNSFRSESFSLLHGAFDMNSDLFNSKLHAFALTTPEIVIYSLYWAMFGGTGNDDLEVDRIRMDLAQNRDKFGSLFPSWESRLSGGGADDGINRYSRFYFAKPEDAEQFRALFDQKYLSVLRTFFGQFTLLSPHYAACKDTEDWFVGTGGNSTQALVWRKVFCGGEGLYWSMIDDTNHAVNQSLTQYRKAIDEVQDFFRTKRAERFRHDRGLTDQVFESFRTRAFQAGYTGAVEYLSRYVTDGNYADAADRLINRLNEYSFEQWTVVFTELKNGLLGGGLDPKDWPMYRNVLIRLYDGSSEAIYHPGRLLHSPDWLVYQKKLKSAANGYSINEDVIPPDTTLRARSSALLSETESLLNRCGIGNANFFAHDDVLNRGFEYLRDEVKKDFP